MEPAAFEAEQRDGLSGGDDDWLIGRWELTACYSRPSSMATESRHVNSS